MFNRQHVFRVRRLYKLILRVHRGLPAELRIMGNNYAREEFKRHRTCKLEEADIFLNEWTDYAINLARQLKPLHQAKKKTVGLPLDPKMLDFMSDDQIVQLHELHKAANDIKEGAEDIEQAAEDNEEGDKNIGGGGKDIKEGSKDIGAQPDNKN